jgi:hypothetical protein
MRPFLRTLVLVAGLLTNQHVVASTMDITAPRTFPTTAGLGFSIAAIVWSQTGDSLRVTLSGEPDGLSYRFLRLSPGYGVATLSGIAPISKRAKKYQLRWRVFALNGSVLAETPTSLRILPPPNSGGDMAAKVRQLLCRHYEYGVYTQEVRDLGPGSLPFILEVLRDTTCEDHWAGAVAAAGALGLPTAFDSLHVFLWHRFSGDVDTMKRGVFSALFYAQVAMGLTAPSRPDVIDSLIAGTDPQYWARLPWHYGRTHLDVLMTGRSILALSMSNDGRSVAALERLSRAPFTPYQKSYVSEGIERQRKVLDRGWQAVREEGRRQNQE